MRHFAPKNIVRTTACAAIGLFSLTGLTQEDDLDTLLQTHGLSEFNLSQLPMLQFFDDPYVVSRNGNELVISHSLPERANELRIGEQAYIWENRGEFGGNLWLRSPAGLVSVMEGPIVDLLPLDGEIFVISGLAHLGMTSGMVHSISFLDNPAEANYITMLPDAPMLVYLDDDQVDYPRKVLVGSKSLISLDPNNRVEVLYWDAFWAFGLRPTSIIRYTDHYLIGLPHGIATVPAPWGPASQYCRNDSSYLAPNSCTSVKFYADEKFRSEIQSRAPLYTRPIE